jgi:hypothetical protein
VAETVAVAAAMAGLAAMAAAEIEGWGEGDRVGAGVWPNALKGRAMAQKQRRNVVFISVLLQ